jgi:hypothetical protein
VERADVAYCAGKRGRGNQPNAWNRLQSLADLGLPGDLTELRFDFHQPLIEATQLVQ